MPRKQRQTNPRRQKFVRRYTRQAGKKERREGIQKYLEQGLNSLYKAVKSSLRTGKFLDIDNSTHFLDFIESIYGQENLGSKADQVFASVKRFLRRLEISKKLVLPNTMTKNFFIAMDDPVEQPFFHEGLIQFDLHGNSDRKTQKIGTVRFHVLPENTIIVGGIQGTGISRQTLREQLKLETGKPWAENLMHTVISEARKQGMKRILLIKPQEHLEYKRHEKQIWYLKRIITEGKAGPDEIEYLEAVKKMQETMSRLYYGVARKFGFKEIEGKYFELELQ